MVVDENLPGREIDATQTEAMMLTAVIANGDLFSLQGSEVEKITADISLLNSGLLRYNYLISLKGAGASNQVSLSQEVAAPATDWTWSYRPIFSYSSEVH